MSLLNIITARIQKTRAYISNSITLGGNRLFFNFVDETGGEKKGPNEATHGLGVNKSLMDLRSGRFMRKGKKGKEKGWVSELSS